jgi:predicted metalloprotease with PDZ domain
MAKIYWVLMLVNIFGLYRAEEALLFGEKSLALAREYDFREQLAYMIQMLKMQRGRRWRSLEDTAATSYQLRSNSRYWRMLRRSQDYYEEGTLYWMEVDCMIRQETSGKRSLDDFCKSFFNVDVAKSKPGYNVDDICKALHAVANRDWQGFFDRRVSHPHDSIPLDVVGLAGYRLEFQPAKNSFQALVESRRGDSDECVSLGMRVSESGSVNTVVPGSVADKHGLCKGVKVVAIDGRQYSRDRLTSAIAQSVQTRKIELIVQHHQRLRNVTLPYKDGKKYLRMTRDSTKPDLLSQIVRARSTRVR